MIKAPKSRVSFIGTPQLAADVKVLHKELKCRTPIKVPFNFALAFDSSPSPIQSRSKQAPLRIHQNILEKALSICLPSGKESISAEMTLNKIHGKKSSFLHTVTTLTGIDVPVSIGAFICVYPSRTQLVDNSPFSIYREGFSLCHPSEGKVNMLEEVFLYGLETALGRWKEASTKDSIAKPLNAKEKVLSVR